MKHHFDISAKANFVAAFTVLALTYAGPMLSGNEEHYLALAKQFMNPDWIPGSFSFTEFPGARLIYQLIVGSLLSVFSFEVVQLLGELSVIGASAYAIMLIMDQYRLSWPNTVLLLSVFISGQSLLGNHNMFTGFEAKHIAYAFNLFMLLYISRHKYTEATLMALIATFFHFLVGGWAAFYLFLTMFYQAYQTKNNELYIELVMVATAYVVCTLPFAYYLSSGIDTANETVSYIYTHMRNPHHTLAFTGYKQFFIDNAAGILASLAGAAYLLHGNRGPLYQYGGIALLGTVAFAVIAIFDGTGVLTKYLPFRISNVAVFILLLALLTDTGVKYIVHRESLSAILFSASLLAIPVSQNIYNQYQYVAGEKYQQIRSLAKIAKAYTNPNDVFIDLSGTGAALDSDGPLMFERLIERPFYVSFKFVPAGTSKILDWSDRIRERQIAKRTGVLPEEVDFVVDKTDSGRYYVLPVKEYGRMIKINR